MISQKKMTFFPCPFIALSLNVKSQSGSSVWRRQWRQLKSPDDSSHVFVSREKEVRMFEYKVKM